MGRVSWPFGTEEVPGESRWLLVPADAVLAAPTTPNKPTDQHNEQLVVAVNAWRVYTHTQAPP